MRILKFLKKAYREFTGGSIIADIALIFTVITLVNSIMMVVGWDQPKLGAFAYLHLLGRLGIVSLVVVVWEYDIILSYLKSLLSKQRAPLALGSLLCSPGKNWFSTVAVLFTIATAITAAGVVLFQEMLEPVGGERLYWNLLFLFAALTVSVLAYSMIFCRSQTK